MRRKALNEAATTLQALLEYGKILELTASQISALENTLTEGVNEIKSTEIEEWNGMEWNGMDFRNKGPSRSGSSNIKCRNCGGSYPHAGGKTCCPAYQKECNNCGKLGHFKSVCRSEPKPKRSGQQRGNLRALEEDLCNSDDENTFRISIHSVHGKKAKHPLFKVKIGKNS